MSCRINIRHFIIITFVFTALPQANGLRVDIAPKLLRTDMFTPRWNNWTAESGNTITTSLGNIDVSFRNAGPFGTGIRCAWYKPLIVNNATLTCDGITVDETSSGGAVEMAISGLSEGRHSLVTWHSFYDNVTGSTMDVSVNGDVRHSGLSVPTRVEKDTDARRVYVEFNAQADQDVIVKYSAQGDGDYDNVVINAFEIDGTDPAFKISDASPAEGDYHYPIENGLHWTPAQNAVSHEIYLGEDSASVDNASYNSQTYKGNITEPHYNPGDLSTFKTFWWRVDEVFEDTTVKGDVIPFKIARLAFPTAMGYGRFARGGRGGRVVEVTNLNDNGPGSLRYALEQEKGPRTVIFRVGGVIPLESKLIIPDDGGDVYIAGQTAPGDGICVTRYAMGPLGAEDVIIRHIRLRVGDYSQDAMDGMGMASCNHSIIDHCSISWSVDEAYSSRGAKNITYQRNLISEALNNSVHFNGSHSFAASISGNIGSFLYNLHAHCAGRNWSLAGGLEQDAKTYGGYVEIANNVVYNWRHRTTDGGVRRLNFVNNYYKGGPESEHWELVSIDGDEINTGDMQMGYVSGNKMVDAEGGVVLSPDEDNWRLCSSEFSSVSEVRSDTLLFPLSIDPVTPDEAYDAVLDDVGANKPAMDAIDSRIIQEVRDATYTHTGSRDGLKGIIDTQDDAGGYPEMNGGNPLEDSDHDGMPDEWETEHGLDPYDNTDRNDTNLSANGNYTNLEMYLNQLAGDPLDWKTSVPNKKSSGMQSDRSLEIGYNSGNVALHLTQSSHIEVELFNSLGRRISVMFKGIPVKDKISIPLNKNLAKGLYFIRVTLGQKGPKEIRTMPVTNVP